MFPQVASYCKTFNMKTEARILPLELTILLAVLACLPMRGAVSVSPEELGEASQWVAAKFKGRGGERGTRGGAGGAGEQ